MISEFQLSSGKVTLKDGRTITFAINKHPHIRIEDHGAMFDDFYNIYKQIIKPNWWCLDIGANVGLTSLAMSCFVGTKGRVICVEPNPLLNEILLLNLKINRLSEFDIYKVGFFDINKIVRFAYSPSQDNGGIFNGDWGGIVPDANFMDLPCRKPYEFLLENYSKEELAKIKFIKIDIEGLDYLIIKELKLLLDSNKPILMVEKFNSERAAENLRHTLKDFDYKIHSTEDLSETTFDEVKQDFILIPK